MASLAGDVRANIQRREQAQLSTDDLIAAFEGNAAAATGQLPSLGADVRRRMVQRDDDRAMEERLNNYRVELETEQAVLAQEIAQEQIDRKARVSAILSKEMQDAMERHRGLMGIRKEQRLLAEFGVLDPRGRGDFSGDNQPLTGAQIDEFLRTQ